MTQRPPLNLKINPSEFADYYWLKAELVAFCREHGLTTSGSKIAITARIQHFLETGEKRKPRAKPRKTKAKADTPLELNALIREDFRANEVHRTFFKQVISPAFKFTVGFMQFCKENAGKKTYQDAVDWWIDEHRRKQDLNYQPDIAPQFEYNRFIRAYFQDQPDGNLKEAIRLWKATKAQPGSNEYHPPDE